MRPRVFPAEDVQAVQECTCYEPASMRPRVFPAEDATGIAACGIIASCFNEAAGIPRGRHDAQEE